MVNKESPVKENNQIILGYSKPDFEEWGGKVSLSYPVDKLMIGLIFGGSGSGKSTSALWILSSIIRSVPVEITLIDFKNDTTWQFLDGYPRYYTGMDCYEALKQFYNEYAEIRNSGKPSDIFKLLVFDEYPSFLNYYQTQEKIDKPSKDKTSVYKHSLAMVSELMCLSRSLNVGIQLICQYPTSDLFANARENLQYKIGLGNISSEARKMIFGNYEIPKILNKTGEGILVVEGYEPALVKYPKIKDISDFKYHLFRVLMNPYLQDIGADDNIL